MQLFSRNKAIVALALSALALGACGDDVTVPVAPAAPTTLSITPPSATMNVGEAVNFAVQISNSASTLASCTSSSATVATATVSGSSCRVTAIGAGNATITAAASTGQSAAASVSVVAPAPAITALAVSPSAAQLAVGSSVTVVPTVNRANSTVAVVYTYTSSTASVATVSATGMVTAVAPGTTTITVTAAGTGTGFAAASLTSAATITVSDRAPGLTSLQVSPATAALTVGGTQAVTASAQGPRASAATITYGTSAPAIATVSATGVITAVAAGTATITVTAQSTQEGAFAASSMTGLVTVTVSNPAVVSINISALTQGPTTTSYASANGVSGIVSAANAQVGQAIDINNTRDQIQMTATLATNGARVDSVVAYVANADGTNRTSVGSQSFPSAAASGPVSLYINTADFTANFTAGTAAVKFANGQKRISVSAFSGATELQSTNSQTVNFNNVDGYASSATAPATTATNSAGQVWFGGRDSLTTRLGSATIVPVFYTAGRTLTNITVAMRQGAGGETQVCSEYLVFQTRPYKFVYGGAQAVAGDTTVVNCSTLESAADHVVGVSAATDNNGSAAPTTSWAGGFRTSITVPAPVARKLDYVAPTVTAVNRTQTLPAVTGWVNASYNFNTQTAVSTDGGSGFAGIDGKSGRTWQWYSCGVLSTAPNTFSGSAADLAECATNNSAAAYSIRYIDSDLVGNTATSAAVSVGVDKTAPVGRWASTSPAADSVGSGAATLTPQFFDARAGFADDAADTAFVNTEANRATRGFVVRANGGLLDATYATASARCYRVSGNAVTSSGNPVSAGSSFLTAPSCSASAIGNAVLSVADVDGYRSALGMSAVANTITLASMTATDKAGNTVTITRRYLADASAPSAAAIAAPAAITTSNPTLGVTYTDNVKVVGATVNFDYGTNLDGAGGVDKFVLPYQSQSTAFGTPLNATSATATLSVGTPAPMATSVNVTGATSYTKLANFGLIVFDAAALSNTGTDVMAAGGITTQTALTSGLSFTVGTSLAAANGAGAGLKATFNTASLSGTNVFARVDFYRKNGADNFEYVGSGATAVQSTDLSGNQIFTYVIDSYANKPTAAVAQTPAAAGETFLAMAVRSTGAATISTASTIGGPAITVTIAGTDGNAGNVVITGPSGFTQTVTVSGTYGMPVAGDYTVTQYPVTTASGGRYFLYSALPLYNPANLSLGTLTLVANGTPQTVTATYYASKFALTYTNQANTAAWSSVPAGAYVTLAHAATGFSQQFLSATSGFVLAGAGSDNVGGVSVFAPFTASTASGTATSPIAIEGVSGVTYNLTVSGGTFTPTKAANSVSTVDVAYEWNKAISVAYVCGDWVAGVFTAGTCPASLSGGYLIGDEATAGTVVTRKTVTGAASGKVHGLATSAASTKLRFNGSFSSTVSGVVTSAGWISSTATADSAYGVNSAAVTPGLAAAAVAAPISINLVQAKISMLPALLGGAGGAAFHPSVTITKAGDVAGVCTVTLDAVTSGAAASATRLYFPTCGAGTYFASYNSTVVGGNTVAWIAGAGARIQSAVITGAAPAPTALAAVWMN